MNHRSIHTRRNPRRFAGRLAALFLAMMPMGALSQGQDWEIEFKSGDAFIENKGQYDGRDLKPGSEILYGIDQNPIYVFFTKKGLSYRFDRIEKHKSPGAERSHRRVVGELHHMEWVGSNPNVQVIADQERPDGYSFSRYTDAQHSGTIEYHPRAFEKITYVNLYPNIDVEYVIHPDGGFKYSVILHPGADPSVVRMRYGNGSELSIGTDGQLQLRGDRGEMNEMAPYTYAQDKSVISSKFVLDGQDVSFELGSYDNSKLVVIDPWVISPTFSTSNAVWEVEHDAAGNVYAIGGESPMLLKKFSSAGALVWTHTTPWDTSSHWLGTMATDDAGNTYITAGTNAEIRKVTTANATVWTQNHGTAGGLSTEFWSITFNCDQTKLTVGGTQGSIPPMGSIHEIETTSGSHLGNTQVSSGSTLFSPVEVRGVASSDNARYYYISHNSVGAISDNTNLNCGNGNGLFFDNPSGFTLSYKCEDYLPENQNGGGLKAIAANGQYFYTHRGDEVHQRSLADGSIINTATIPSGVSNSVFGGGRVVENCGIDVDAAGNVYVGSKNLVVKYDANLNQLATAAVNMTVYDVDVNANNEIVACGAQNDNGSTNRNGRIQAVNMSSAGTFPLICCDANVCPAGPFCDNDAPFDLIESTAGGTWSGNGVNAVTGVFDPAAAGVGNHWIVYTLPCGSDSIEITVMNCAPMDVCVEANGDLTVSGGSGTYTWQEEQVISSGCVNGLGNCAGIFSFTDPAPPTATWVDFSTNATIDPNTDPTTTPPPATPWQIVDGNGTIFTISDISALPACGGCTNPVLSETHVDESCPTALDGSIDLTITGSSTYSISWSPGGQTTEDLSGLATGSYTVTVTDQADANCSATLIVNIGQGTSADASFTVTDFCEGDANNATVTGTPGGTFAFNPMPTDGATIDASTGEISNGVGGTTYTVEYTTPAGPCQASGTQTVTVNTVPSVDAGVDLDVCEGDMVTLTAVNPDGATISWDNSVNDGVAFPATSGTTTYTVTADLAGCVSTDQVVVDADPVPTFTLSFTDPTGCGATDGTITISGLNASTGYDVSYDDGAGVVGPNPMTSNASGDIVINGLGAGAYSDFQVTLLGCSGTDPSVITLSDPGAPSVDAGTDQTVCEGAQVTLTATVTPAGGSLSWSGSVQDGVPFTPPVGTNTYSVTVDQSGCVATDQVTVTVNPTEDASFTASDFCLGSTNVVAITGDAGGTFSFNPAPGDGATIDPGTGVISNAVDGNSYTIEYTTGGSCAASTTVTVSVSNIVLSAVTTDDQCSAGVGAIDLTVSGASGSYTYDWQPGGQTTQDVNSLTSGTYTVVVTDATDGNCSATDSYTIGDNGAPPAPAVVFTQETCTGDCNATITVTLAQPDSVVYSINNGGQVWSNYTGVFTDLCPGDYMVTVDGLGCPYPTNQVLLISAPSISWDTSQTYPVDTDCQVVGGNGSVSAAADGGWVDQFTYQWFSLPNDTNSISSNPTLGNLVAGDYMVVATEDSTGCTMDTILSIGTINPIAYYTVDTTWAFTPEDFDFENTSQNSSSWTWEVVNSDGDTAQYATTDFFFAPDTTLNEPDTIRVCLYAFNSYGCSDVHCKTIVLVPPLTLVTPNVFTPNNHGNNELFYIPGEGIAEYEVTIFSRWGRVIKELDIDSRYWDGTLENGTPASEGVYFYIYRIVGFDGTEYKGQAELHLIRN